MCHLWIFVLSYHVQVFANKKRMRKKKNEKEKEKRISKATNITVDDLSSSFGHGLFLLYQIDNI